MNGRYMRTHFEFRSRPCYRCHLSHVKEVTVTEGPYKGFVGEEPEYELLAAFGPFGIGVAFSALSVFVVQGSITLLASKLLFLQSPNVLNAITATGGLLILGIGINLLEIRIIRTGNLLPALLYAIVGALILG